MGWFLSRDPVVNTPERFANPQQLNLYAYVANNPLRYVDPTGEVLQCVGNSDQRNQCFSDLQQIVGEAAVRVAMDAKSGAISFDTKDLDLSKNEGAGLVNDLVGSNNTYDFSVGPTNNVPTSRSTTWALEGERTIHIRRDRTPSYQEMTMRIPYQFALLAAVLFFAVGTVYATELVIQKEISVSHALAGQAVVWGTGEPVSGATVELYSSDWKTMLASTKTDKQGHFSLEKPVTGKLFYVRVSAPGMDSYELRVRVKKQAAKELTICLRIAT